MDCLRSSNYVNLLTQLKNNIDRSFTNIPLFEIGPYFEKDLNQKLLLQLFTLGIKNYSTWIEPNKLISIYDIKEDLLYVLSDAGIDIDNLFIKRSQKNIIILENLGRYLNETSKECIASFGEITSYDNQNILI